MYKKKNKVRMNDSCFVVNDINERFRLLKYNGSVFVGQNFSLNVFLNSV